MRIPRRKRKLPKLATKSILCIMNGEYYMDCPDGYIMAENDWWDIYQDTDWIPVFEPIKQL